MCCMVIAKMDSVAHISQEPSFNLCVGSFPSLEKGLFGYHSKSEQRGRDIYYQNRLLITRWIRCN